jgi:trans-aconitate methyltransferase
VSDELLAAGAQVVALDRAPGMLAFRRAERPPGVVADAAALPVRPAGLAAVAAGCCLAHLPDAVSALRQLGSTLTEGGVVAASAFPTAWRDPLKAAVEVPIVAAGWRPPPWYAALKCEGASATGEPGPFRDLAAAAGLEAEVRELVVPVALPDTAAVVDWRLGMAQTAPWVDTLAPAAVARLRAAVADAVRTVAGVGPVGLDIPLLVLLARVP